MKTLTRLSIVALISAICIPSSGCASFGTYQTADTLGTGRFAIAVEPAFQMAAGVGGWTGWPRFDLAVRGGVSDSVDIGGRLGQRGLEFNAKFMLTNPENRKFMASIAPSIGGMAFALGDGSGGSVAVGAIHAQLPVLLGIGFGPHQLVIGPKVHNWTFFGLSTTTGGGGAGTINILSVGTSIGFAAKLGKVLVLMPEINVLYPIWASAAVTGNNGGAGVSEFAGQGVFLEFGLSVGFEFGKGKPAPTPTAPAAAPPADDGYDDGYGDEEPPADSTTEPEPEPTPDAAPEEPTPDSGDDSGSSRVW